MSEKTQYPSDISREQFNEILPILESVNRSTKPRIVDLYEVFCGVLYLLREGCRWRAIPKEYPNWKLIYYYFTLWKKTGTLDKILKKIG